MTLTARISDQLGACLNFDPGRRIQTGHAVWLAALLVTGLALALLPLAWLFVALPGFIVVGLALIWPQFALYLLCFAIPFGSLFETAVGSGITVGVTEGLIALAVATWPARTMAWRRPYNWPWLTVPLLLFVGAAGLSFVNADSLPLALKEMIKWIEFLAIVLIVANLTNQRQRQVLVSCLLLAGIGQAALGAYQFLTRSGPEFFAIGRFVRAYGTFEQPNPYAGYLGLTAPLALALALVYRAERDSSSTTERRLSSNLRCAHTWRSGGSSIPGWLRWLAVVGFFATTAGIGMSGSRGGWLAFAAAVVVVNVAQSRKGAALFTAAILVVLLAGLVGGFRLLPQGILQRLTSFLPFVAAGDVRSIEVTDANYASLERLAFWQAALDMWRERPWLGIGFGNYQAVYPRFSLPKWRMALGHAHNYYLNIAAETGLVGLLAYLALWAAAIWQTVRAQRKANDAFSQALALGALGVLVHLSMHNVVDNLWVHNVYIHVAIVLGLVQPQSAHDRSLEINE